MSQNGKLDPRSKLAIFIVACFTAFSGITPKQEMFLITICVGALLIEKEWVYVFKIGVLFCVLYLLDMNVIENLTGTVQFIGLTFCHCFRFILPIIAAAHLVIHTATIGEYISALMVMRCPNSIIIPIAVMFRFLPTIKEEFTAIKRAMKMRNMSGGFHLLEYALVPLLLQSSVIVDELSAAVMARGLERNSSRTGYVKIGLKGLDFLTIGFGMSFFVWTLLEHV